MKRSYRMILPVLALLIVVPSVSVYGAWYQDAYAYMHMQVKKIDKSTQEILLFSGVCTAIVGLVWWLAQDRRSDEQVIADVKRFIDTTSHKYGKLVQLHAQARLASFQVLDELLLCTLIEQGVDKDCFYYLNQAVTSISKELNTLSKRIEKSKDDNVCKRMKIIRTELQNTADTIRPLHTYLQYHEAYLELSRIIVALQRIYGQPCTFKTSEKKLLQYVDAQKSVYALYPYFDYVEKLENSIKQLKKCMHSALYAKNSELYANAQELCESLRLIKGTLASTEAYRHDVQNRERDRARAREVLRKEVDHAAHKISQHLHEAQVYHDRIAIQKEREQLSREKDALQKERRKQEKKRKQREQEVNDQKLKNVQNAYPQDDSIKLQQELYQMHNSYPSAPPFEEPECNALQMPEPTAPYEEQEENQQLYIADEDLDALFKAMEQELDHETNETNQFQKDFGYTDDAIVD